jgi:hypothetical protein
MRLTEEETYMVASYSVPSSKVVLCIEDWLLLSQPGLEITTHLPHPPKY